MLFAGYEVRIVNNCDRGLENAAQGRRPRAAFLSLRSQLSLYGPTLNKKITYLFFCKLSNEKKKTRKKLTQALLWPWQR